MDTHEQKKESIPKINFHDLSAILTGSIGVNLNTFSLVKSEDDFTIGGIASKGLGCTKDETNCEDIKISTVQSRCNATEDKCLKNFAEVKAEPMTPFMTKNEIIENEMDCDNDIKGDADVSDNDIKGDADVSDNDNKDLIKTKDYDGYCNDNSSNLPLKCTMCNKVCYNSKKLKLHLKIWHNRKNVYECKPCDCKLLTTKHFIEHFEKCRFGYLQAHIFSCQRCSKKFPTKKQLNDHIIAQHNKGKPWHCNLCGKSFTREKILNFHISTHRELWQSCGVCKRPFRKPSDLKKHMITHDNKIPYFCIKCKLGFKEKNHFKKHKKEFHKKRKIRINNSRLNEPVNRY